MHGDVQIHRKTNITNTQNKQLEQTHGYTDCAKNEYGKKTDAGDAQASRPSGPTGSAARGAAGRPASRIICIYIYIYIYIYIHIYIYMHNMYVYIYIYT